MIRPRLPLRVVAASAAMIRTVLVLAIAFGAAACGPNFARACENVLSCQGERVGVGVCDDNEAFTSIDPDCAGCLSHTECINGRIACADSCSCEVGVVYGASVCR